MKAKSTVSLLLSAVLLTASLSGCSAPAEESIQPSPSAVTDENGITTLTNVVVMDVRGTTLELMEQSDDPNNLYRYELVVPDTDSSFWQDAQGNPVSVEQFTYRTPVTVELNKELGQPALETAEQEWDRNVFTYRVTCLGENDLSVRLTGEPRPEAAPFETLTRAQVASGELFQGNSQPLGEQDLDKIVGYLQGIQATVQTQPGEDFIAGGYGITLTLTDGSILTLLFGGDGYNLSVESQQGTNYYCIRSVYLDDLELLTNHLFGYDNVRL